MKKYTTKTEHKNIRINKDAYMALKMIAKKEQITLTETVWRVLTEYNKVLPS